MHLTGQTTVIRKFVVYPITADIIDADAYYLNNKKWLILRTIKHLRLGFGAKLKDNFTGRWQGFNHGDVIITKLKDNKVMESEYFLKGTLSNASNIKQLID